MKSDEVAERVGNTLNELDVDFSNLSWFGWATTITALAVGTATTWWMYLRLAGLRIDPKGVGLALFLTQVGVTTGVFLAVRWLGSLVGLAIMCRDKAAASNRLDGSVED